MAAPNSKEELENSSWYGYGVQLRKDRGSLKHVLSAMNPNSWQYDAVIAGYDDETARRKAKRTAKPATA